MMAQGGEQLGPDADSQMGIQLGFTEWPALVESGLGFLGLWRPLFWQTFSVNKSKRPLE